LKRTTRTTILNSEKYQVLMALAKMHAENWGFCQATRNDLGANRSKQLAENFFKKASEMLEKRLEEIDAREQEDESNTDI
jgi:hypothetical protein